MIKTQPSRGLWFVPAGAILCVLPFILGQTAPNPTTTGPTTFKIRSQTPTSPTEEAEPVAAHSSSVPAMAPAPIESPTRKADETSPPTHDVNEGGSASSTASPSTSAISSTQPSPRSSQPAQARSLSPGQEFGLWTLLPAMVAIILAVATQQVVPSLALGILTGAVMMCVNKGIYNPIEMVMYAVDHYLLGVFVPRDPTNVAGVKEGYSHLRVIVFTQFIGGMIGVIEANGGTRAMVARVTHWMRTPRTGQMGALAGGILIFFDDYANALILGPSMRPVFDKLRLSRAKLAYIVDSTAAPVASLFIGTWLAAEINFLDKAFSQLGPDRPEFLKGLDGSAAFWSSIPYRTYAWLALFFVFIIALTGRDFGPMKKSEREALLNPPSDASKTSGDGPEISHWALGLLPVLTLVVMTLFLLIITGRNACAESNIQYSFDSIHACGSAIQTILAQSDSYTALLYAGITAAVVAVTTTIVSRTLPMSKTFDALTNGMQRIFGAQIVLILAWGLASVMGSLELDRVACDFLQAQVDKGNFEVPFLPTAIFITAAIISFSTGTSWGTMGILCPTTVAIAARLLAPLPVEHATPIFFSSIGAVLTGAVFGDHCSPISDTTVLSAITTECSLAEHVRTQLPYAFIIAIVGLLFTDVLDFFLIEHHPDFYNHYWNVYYGTALAAIVLFLILMIVGRKVKPRGYPPHPSRQTMPPTPMIGAGQ